MSHPAQDNLNRFTAAEQAPVSGPLGGVTSVPTVFIPGPVFDAELTAIARIQEILNTLQEPANASRIVDYLVKRY